MRVGRPWFPILAYTERDARRKRQQAGRKNKNENAPLPTQEPRGKHRENTVRGTHQPREKKRHQGGGKGKRGKGNPTNPERNRQAPLDAERKEPEKRSEIAWGKRLLELIQLEEVQAQRRARAQVVDKRKKQNNKNTTPKSCRQSVLLILVVLKTTVIGTMHPHPGTPKQRKQRTLQGRSLKGSRDKIEVPKHQTFLNFPNTNPKP